MKKTIKTVKKTVKAEKPVERSAAYLAQKAYIEEYALRHPEKYEATKERLLAHLNTL